jgi:MSHA pilin protein MshC
LKGKEMSLSFRQFEIFTLDTEHFCGAQTKAGLFYSPANDPQRGFTLVELVMTIVILGIIAAVAVPRLFNNNVFQSRGFADQVQATLRYAQKEAIAQRGFVCVAVTTSSIALTAGTTSACSGGSLALPTGGNSISAPPGSGITLSVLPGPLPVNFNFDALGRTAVQQTITVFGATNKIIVEAETGYVHSP